MLAANGYNSKKDLKASIGKRFRYTETSIFGNEFKTNSTLTVVGPSPYQRKWYATVRVDDNGIITAVN